MRRSTALGSALLAAVLGLSFASCNQSTANPNPYGTSGDTSSTTAGSGGQGGTGGAAGAAGAAGAGGAAPVTPPIEARFQLPTTGAPTFLDVPFPTDLYLDATGHVTNIQGLGNYVPANSPFLIAGFAPLNGWGTSGGALFEIDDTTKGGSAPTAALIDTTTLPSTEAESTSATSTAMIVDLDATSAATALIPARADYHDDSAYGSTALPLLVVWPARGIVLKEAGHYAVVLTTGVKTTTGQPIGASPTFADIRDGKTRSTPAEQLYGNAVDTVAKLVPALASKTSISVMAVYSTHNSVHELADLRGQFIMNPAPTLDWTPADILPMGPGLFAAVPVAGYTATLDDWLGTPAQLPGGKTCANNSQMSCSTAANCTMGAGCYGDDPANDQMTGVAHDAIAAMGTAVFNAPNLLVQDPSGYNDPTHQTFARDANGNPIVNPAAPTSKIWITIALPLGSMPANGFPTVIIQHGLGQERSFILTLADTFAKQGWASVAIESVTFGARAAEMANTVDAKSVFPWSANAAYNGPDGFVDVPNGSTDFFGGLKDIGAIRDQMRQSILDIEAAYDVIRNPALDLTPLLLAVPGAKLDRTKVAFVGNSLGAMMGSMVAATDPNLTTFVLNVAGGGIMTELGAYSPDISSSLNTAGGLNFGFFKAQFSPSHPLVQIFQHLVDTGDPLLYGSQMITSPVTINGTVNPPKNVVQIQVIWDEIVPNQANEALARAAGFPLASPDVGSNTGLTFPVVMPTSGNISGVPMASITAVLVQAGPATHGADLYDAMGQRDYMIPYAQFGTPMPFTMLPMPVNVVEPYLGLQTMVTGFFSSAFAGGGPPVLAGFPTPTTAYTN
jgi:dienelactone hydrolase